MNKIKNWTYDTPTEPGMYLMCYGDIEVPQNIYLCHFNEDMVNQHGNNSSDYGAPWKWARLGVGSEAKGD